jgi:hypothetical protein
MRPRSLLLSSLASSLALSLAACGGGGGGGGSSASPAQLAGEYRFVGIAGFTDSVGGARRVTTQWGAADSDGVDTMVLRPSRNASGTVTTALATTLDYGVAGDGTLDMGDATFRLGGMLGSAGRLAVVGVTDGFFPSMLVFGKVPEDVVHPADFQGLYHLIEMDMEPATGRVQAVTATLTSDGAGNLTIGPGTVNLGGSIFSSVGGSTGTWFALGDGALSMTLAATTFSGFVLEGGDLVLMSGGRTSGDRPTIVALVKAASAASASTLRGTYGVASFEFDGALGELRSFAGRLVASASGLVRTGTTNVEGVVVPADAWSVDSWVTTSQGGLTITDPAGDVLRGGVSEDGRFAVLGGGTSSGSRSTFQVLVRR